MKEIDWMNKELMSFDSTYRRKTKENDTFSISNRWGSWVNKSKADIVSYEESDSTPTERS